MLGVVTDFVSSPRGKWVTLLVWVLAAGVLLSQLPRLDEVRENEEALFLPVTPSRPSPTSLRATSSRHGARLR